MLVARATVTLGALAALLVGTTNIAHADTPTVTDAPDGPVVILHTDSAGDARSPELRTALADLGATVRHDLGGQQALSVELPASATADELDRLPGVHAFEPAVRRTLADVSTPTDPYYRQQAAYLGAVAAPAAWQRQHGSAKVTIAVVDSGIDLHHPDLAGKVVAAHNAMSPTVSITDAAGHGTFVAGVAAANTGNGVGVAGAGYDTRLMAVKVADANGDIVVDDEIAGIRWAADHGADIINLSLSGSDASTAELNAVRYAQSKGALIVAAAGNEGTPSLQYPAAYPGVVSVAATDVASGRRASFSSYGSWVTLAAPGTSIVSTVPTAGSRLTTSRTGYAVGDGTSFATPLVSGAAALLKAQNPAMSAAAIRAALVASAHGYTGLGAGQVDFDLALRHVTPASTPTALPTLGTAGTVTLEAQSSAPRVAFRIDTDTWSAPVPVTAGVARLDVSSYGYANDRAHTAVAADCSEFGECNLGHPATLPSFTLHNAAPALTAPATVSGRTSLNAHADGGALRLLVDGQPAGFAAAPYDFVLNGSRYANGTHTLSVQSCTPTQSHCEGPASVPQNVTFDSLHPALTLSRAAISPNGDGSGDTAAVTLGLDAPQAATAITRDSTGATRRTEALPAGATSFTFTGRDDTGKPLPDGAYTLAVETTDGSRHGLAERAVTIDTVRPRLAAVTGNNTTFYPAVDGYRDTFAPTAALPDGGVLTLTITNAAGRTARTLQASHAAIARTALPWNGRAATGQRVPAGSYGWIFSVTDAAGNVTRSAGYRVTVAPQRLHTDTLTVTQHARAKHSRGTAKCAGKTKSSYKSGNHLVNRCRGGSDEVGYAEYLLQMPAAYRYHKVQVQVYGRSKRTSQVVASFIRTDGGLEVPRAAKIKKGKARWRSIATVPSTAHIDGARRLRFALLLTSHYAGANDFDARSVRVRVTLTRLR